MRLSIKGSALLSPRKKKSKQTGTTSCTDADPDPGNADITNRGVPRVGRVSE